MLEQAQYNRWNRSDWSNFYHYLTENTPNQNEILWQLWDVEQNPNRTYFKSVESLIFNLVHYKPNAPAIGSFTITADSVPIYNTWSNWWNNIAAWECNHWIEWFEKNQIKYGAAATKQKFVNAWSYPDNFSIGLWGDGAGYICGRDCDFINYFRVKGIDVTVWGAQTVCNLVSIPTNLIDATASLSNTVKKTANVVETLVPISIAAIIMLFLYNKAKN